MNKYLVVGLGNPGSEYKNTRHNVGFSAPWITWRIKSMPVDPVTGMEMRSDMKNKRQVDYFDQTDTYMNLSGKAVQFWINKLNIEPQNALIIPRRSKPSVRYTAR